MTTGTAKQKPRVHPGELLLVAILVANLVCGAGLIAALRADLTEERIAHESKLASSKIDAFLWGKILQFASAAEEGRGNRKDAPATAFVGPVSAVSDLPAEGRFQRVRSGSGEWLPVFVGTPRDLDQRGVVLPLGFLRNGAPTRERFLLGTISLADLNGYLGDLKRRGIHCRIVDAGGNALLDPEEGGTVRWGSVYRSGGRASVLGGALSREWSVQMVIPDAGSQLPLLPQAVLALFFLLNAGMLLFLRRRFIHPSEAALEAITNTVASHGELLPESPGPRYVAGAVSSLLSRYRMETEAEKRAIEESFERRTRETADSQKNLLAHHRLTKKMLQSRQADEVFDTLLGGISEGYGFPGTCIGKVSDDGFLVFQGETDPVSGSPLRIPLWHPGSLLARTFWSGNLLHGSPRELPHLPEEEAILGSSPVLCLPVMRNLKVRCVEAKNCADRTCPNYYSENLKCWLRNIPPEFFTGGGNPEIHRESIIACLRCEIFPSAALLVVRSVENGKVVTRENAVPISNLASEAGLALEVVSLYDSMKIMAVTDGLTGLYNHREFYQSLRRELERARR